jgi:uncharacterized protein
MQHPIASGRCPAPPGDLRLAAVEREMSPYPNDHAGLEILPFDMCLRLLARVPVGRVSFLADGEIIVLPVNHVMDGQDPVFRTARGSKLSAAEGQDLVAFEADGYDQQTKSGWSVLVNGRAHEVYDEAEIQRLSRLGLHPWVTAVDRPFWIRIRPTSITGRQTPGARLS